MANPNVIATFVNPQLSAWGREPANAQTIKDMQGGQDFFNWLNKPDNPLLNNLVDTRGLKPDMLKQDLQTIMDSAKRNGNSAEGLRQAYETDPSGFMKAVQSGNQADLDQRIQSARNFVGPTAPDQHATLENAEQKAASVLEAPDKTPQQQLTGAVLLEGLQSVMAGDMKMEDLFQAFVDFIGTLLGTKFDGIGQELGAIGNKLGLKPPEAEPAPAAPAPNATPAQPAPETSMAAGPAM